MPSFLSECYFIVSAFSRKKFSRLINKNSKDFITNEKERKKIKFNKKIEALEKQKNKQNNNKKNMEFVISKLVSTQGYVVV